MIKEPIQGLVCDLDGVIYRGDQAIEGAAAAVDRLRGAGIRVLFWTNNSRPSLAEYVDKLSGMEVPVDEGDIVTSSVITATALRERGFKGKRAFVVGGPGIRGALEAEGIELVGESDATSADVVVVGWDLDFDFAAMRAATRALEAGARLVATNDDAAYPAPDGLWPGTGAILASIEVAAGRRGEVMGKPHDPMVEAVTARLSGLGHIAAVGDRPETDLAAGPDRGWTTILVLSGVTSAADAERVDPQPDLILQSIAQLPDALGITQ